MPCSCRGLGSSGSAAFRSRPTAPMACSSVPSTIVGRRNGRSWVTRITARPTHATADRVDTRRRASLLPATSEIVGVESVEFVPGAMSPVAFQAAVATVVARIRAGEVGKVVLARDVVAHIAGGR